MTTIVRTLLAGLILFTGLPTVANALLISPKKDCLKVIKSQTARGSTARTELTRNYQAMRSGCQAFRRCKTGCRNDRQDCRGDTRADKKQCKAKCVAVSPKRKRKACRKLCMADRFTARNECKKTKRSCKSGCRAEMLETSCKQARNTFWNSAALNGEDLIKGCVKLGFPKLP